MAQITCPKCNTDMVAEQRKTAVSIAGIIGVLLTMAGLAMLLFNPAMGVLVIILAVVVSIFGRPKKTVLVCPNCGYERNLKQSPAWL